MMIKTCLLTLRRIFTEKSPWLCCACVFALCFTASVGTAENGDPLNVLSYIFGGEKNPPGADMIISSRGGSWLAMFLPIVSGLCFANVLCDDKSSKYTPINETDATLICCAESREFLSDLGLNGEIISTPSHSKDSISVIMDNGDCFVGDLEPIDYLTAYIDNPILSDDWERIMKFNPKRFLYAHANEKVV